MRYLAILCTFLYIILESATAQMSSAIFFHISSLPDLKNAEQLGYITSGIGVALLLNSILRHRLPLLPRLLLFVACAFSVMNGLHSLIREIPAHLPVSMKQQSINAGVGLMVQPSPRWVTALYGVNAQPSNVGQRHIDMFVRRYGASDLQNRHLLASGIRGIGVFSHHWDLAVEQLDKKSLNKLFYNTHRGTYEQHFLNKPGKPDASWVWRYQYLSTPIPHAGANHALSQLRDWTAHEAAWWAIREKFPFLPIAAPEFTDWSLVFNQNFTAHTLKNYGISSHAPRMPWRGEAKYTALYDQICEEIAPFLFQNGRPVLDISLLRDVQVRNLYVTELHRQLSPKLQALMHDYHARNISSLSKQAESWNNPVRSAPGDGLARLVWLTPWLTLLSWILLLLNAKNLVQQYMESTAEPMRHFELWLATTLSVVLLSNVLIQSSMWQEWLLPSILSAGPAEPNLKII